MGARSTIAACVAVGILGLGIAEATPKLEARIQAVQQIFPPSEYVINVTTEALRKKTSVLEELSGEMREGKPMLLELSAVSCMPCRSAYKNDLVPFAEKHKEVNVVMALLDENLVGAELPAIHAHLRMQYGWSGAVPQLYLTDRGGNVLNRNAGFLHTVEAQLMLEQPDRLKADLTGTATANALYEELAERHSTLLVDSHLVWVAGEEQKLYSNYDIIRFVEAQTGKAFPWNEILENCAKQSATLPWLSAFAQTGPELLTAQEMLESMTDTLGQLTGFSQGRNNFGGLGPAVETYAAGLENSPLYPLRPAAALSLIRDDKLDSEHLLFLPADYYRLIEEKTGAIMQPDATTLSHRYFYGNYPPNECPPTPFLNAMHHFVVEGRKTTGFPGMGADGAPLFVIQAKK